MKTSPGWDNVMGIVIPPQSHSLKIDLPMKKPVIMAMAGFIGVGSRILARVRASRAAAGVATAEAASP
jgi:hypothetical protein